MSDAALWLLVGYIGGYLLAQVIVALWLILEDIRWSLSLKFTWSDIQEQWFRLRFWWMTRKGSAK